MLHNMMFNIKILDLNKCSDIHMQIKPNKNNTYLRFLSFNEKPIIFNVNPIVISFVIWRHGNL